MARRPTLIGLPEDELLVRVADAKNELFNLRFQLATGQLANYKRLGQLKGDVARLLTQLRSLEIAAAEREGSH